MAQSSSSYRMRVMLIDKTRIRRATGVFNTATAPLALGAFCLKSYVELLPELASHLEIIVRSYAYDTPHDLIVHEIVEYRPDVVGMTCQPWNHIDNVRVSRLIHTLLPNIVVMHGGPMVIDRERYLRKAADNGVAIVVEGEAEQTFLELLCHLVLGKPQLEDIAGIGFYGDDGQPRITSRRESPDLSLLPAVMTASHLDALGPIVPYETSRGCPYQCSFCNWGGYKAPLRFRHRTVIEQDLKAILTDSRVRQLWFVDSAVDVSVNHVLFLADVIRRYRRHAVLVGAFFNFLDLDLSYVEALRGAFDFVRIGLQTANDSLLSELGRKELGTERLDRIRAVVLPHFPDLHVDIMFGLPGVTLENLGQSVRFLLDRNIRHINLFRLQALPGTELAERSEAHGIVADTDYPFMVYSRTDCGVIQLLEMQQLKVNMDALRPLFLTGLYGELRSTGVDLVDFAAHLHEYVPRLNHQIEYGMADDDDLDWNPELIGAIFRAAEEYTGEAISRHALLSALQQAYEPMYRGIASSRFGAV